MGHSGAWFIHAGVSLLQGHCHITKEILPWIEILMSFRFRVFLLGQGRINTLIYFWRLTCFYSIVLSLLVRLKSFSYASSYSYCFFWKFLNIFTLFLLYFLYYFFWELPVSALYLFLNSFLLICRISSYAKIINPLSCNTKFKIYFIELH